jgi:hypothetical protein
MFSLPFRPIASLCLLLAGLLVTPAAHAAELITVALTGPSTGSGTARTYTVTVGQVKLQVRVTAWSTAGTSNSSTVKNGTINVYTNGLGVTSTGESTSSPHHTADNLTQSDFLIFQFNQPVELETARLTTYNMGSGRFDGDLTYAVGSNPTNWTTNPLPNTTTYAQLATIFGNSFTASNVASTSSQTTSTRLLNPTNNVGNMWLIGASFKNPAENCGRNTNQLCLDGFKLSQITVRTAVPEPASWLMMILGFGFIGHSLRRRKVMAAIA